MSSRRLGWLGTALVVAGIAVLGASLALGRATGASVSNGWGGGGMMGGTGGWGGGGMMGGTGGWGGGGMMGGTGGWGGGMMGGTWSGRASAPGPGEPGFVAGTPAAPRVVRIAATPQLRFLPDVVTIEAGETITFDVTTMGPTVHEFMVGPAADVAADTAGTPEVADIGMMQTRSVTYTFTGPGPFAFACHAPGHYEAGMTGTITVR